MISLEMNYPVAEVADKMRAMAGPSLKKAMHDGDIENGVCMAGQIAPLVRSIRPAAEIIDSIIAECREVIV